MYLSKSFFIELKNSNLLIPKIFEDKPDLHYAECYDRDQQRQKYIESLLVVIYLSFLIYLKNGWYP